MQYGDWTFYAACLCVAEAVLLFCTLVDGQARRWRRTHPWRYQALVLCLTVVCLYGSDSNKPEVPKPPRPVAETPRVYFHRDEAGNMHGFAVRVIDGEAVTNNVTIVEFDLQQ